MKLNPICKKDELASARSFSLPFLVTAVNGSLSLLAASNISYVAVSAQNSGEISYMNFLRVYYIAAAMELLLLVLIAPAISAFAIAGERERRTFSLLFTTQLRARDIVIGKMMGVMSTLFLLIVTALPTFATVFIYGGVTFREVVLVLVCYLCTALYCTAIGLTASSFIHTTAPAVTVSYVAAFGSFLLFTGLVYFRDSIAGGVSFSMVTLGILGFMLIATLIMLSLSEFGMTPHPARRKKSKEKDSTEK